MRKRSGARAIAVVGLTLFSLTGCVAEHGPLDTASTQLDVLPAVVETSGDTSIDADSVRYQGADAEGADYYAAKAQGKDSRAVVCLVVVVSSTGEWLQACGDQLRITVTFANRTAVLHPSAPVGELDGEMVGEFVNVQFPGT
ncbi:hypothetical protein [Microbacterium sp. JZ31]|uniref:hypothetical protein n=1 Tax=Microbacterium sp. JZ31 TaxID=1906274 RepID=UPI001932A851|nr:hypothetical protein [Microbacterium sp. JZ31]